MRVDLKAAEQLRYGFMSGGSSTRKAVRPTATEKPVSYTHLDVYKRQDNTIEIFMNEKWIVFEQREGDGSKVRYGDRMVDAEDLSNETLEWLDWYNLSLIHI